MKACPPLLILRSDTWRKWEILIPVIVGFIASTARAFKCSNCRFCTMDSVYEYALTE